MKNEPALTAGAVVALVTATLVLLQRFGVKLGAEQLDAIVDLASLVAPLLLPVLGAWYVRQRVTPLAKLDPPKEDPPGPNVRRASIGTLLALALGAPLALSRCAAAPVAAAWLPAVLTALSAAGTLLEQVGHWVDRFRSVIPADIAAKIDGYLTDARGALEQTKALAGKGAEFQAEAEKAYQLLRGLLDKLFAELAGVGLYEPSSERLTAPPTMRAIDGKIQEVESMGVSMPPETLQ